MGYQYSGDFSGNMTLYRGDFSRIEKFDVAKTNAWCFVGPGIYLTNQRPIAQTYRLKGSGDEVVTLFSGEAKDRNDAKEKAFENYLWEACRKDSSLQQNLLYRRLKEDAKYRKTQGDLHRQGYEDLIEAGLIEIDYVEHRRLIYGVSVKDTRRAGQGSTVRDWKHSMPTLKVTWYKNRSAGFLSTFVFPRGLIANNVVHTHAPIRDRSFWELMWDHKVGIGAHGETKESYLDNNCGKSSILSSGTASPRSSLTYSGEKGALAKIRKILTPYGVIGFEYNGGQNTGGRPHRAFCLWDEDLVNRHRVSLER